MTVFEWWKIWNLKEEELCCSAQINFQYSAFLFGKFYMLHKHITLYAEPMV